MAFFDEIGRKITLTGQTAVQKTKDVAEVARLNSSINDEERAIDRAYKEIGKLYISLHSSDYESPFSALIDSVKTSEKKIIALKKQVNDIKKIAHCKNCGAELSSTDTFCSVCGQKAEPILSTSDGEGVVCRNCGKPVKKGLRFCTECGCKVDDEPKQEKEMSPSPTLSKSPADNSDTRTCPSCGNRQKSTLNFCTECGSQMDSKPKDKEPKKIEFSDNAAEGLLLSNNLIEASEERKCPVCGHRQKSTLAFCTECGSRMDDEPKKFNFEKKPAPESESVKVLETEPDQRTCPSCGHRQKSALAFCTECGSRMDSKTESNAPKKTELPKDTNEGLFLSRNLIEKSDERTCPVCGQRQKKELAFCTECGSRMDGEPSKPKLEKEAESEAKKLALEKNTEIEPKPMKEPISKREERVCPSCGRRQDSTLAFCAECGRKMENEPENTSKEKETIEEEEDDYGATVMLMPDVAVPTVIPFLIRKSNNEEFRLNKAVCKIGRDKETNDYVVLGNKYIGHKHCHIITRGEEYFIVDDNSMNHTYVDGVLLEPNTEFKLSHGKIIKLANEEFEFKLF